VVPHLEERLQRDIDRIRDRLREMSDLAVRALEDSVTSLTTGDRRLAYSAILRDSRIDELESVIDNQCVEFMVRHIPVAKHLRFAHSVAKIILELERVGDYAESINRQAILLSGVARTPDLEPYARLAAVAIEMLRQAIRAFLDEDTELADRTRALDEQANRIHQEIYRSLLAEKPQSTEDVSTVFALLSVANRFERVADQAVNVCEEVFYLVRGQIVKHQLKREHRVLFVSSGTSCRSLMAEAIARTLAGKQFQFASAGLNLEPPDPRAVAFLGHRGIDVSNLPAKTLAEIGDLSEFRVVVAIGAEAARAIPKVSYRTIFLEWPLADPAERAAAREANDSDYAAVFDALVDQISELVRGLHGTIESLQPGVRKHV
jgi:phosphate transport system protein